MAPPHPPRAAHPTAQPIQAQKGSPEDYVEKLVNGRSIESMFH